MIHLGKLLLLSLTLNNVQMVERKFQAQVAFFSRKMLLSFPCISINIRIVLNISGASKAPGFKRNDDMVTINRMGLPLCIQSHIYYISKQPCGTVFCLKISRI